MTSFKTIYQRFANKITDYKLLQLEDEDLRALLKEWLDAAISKFRCKSDLTDRDDILEQFNIDLDGIEIEILALRMVSEWLEPQVNSVLLTKQFMGGKDEKFFAQSSQLNELRLLKANNDRQIRLLENRYRLLNNDYLEGQEG